MAMTAAENVSSHTDSFSPNWPKLDHGGAQAKLGALREEPEQ
jgi:hypothetical protein